MATAAQWIRVGPGMYKNPFTGAIIKPPGGVPPKAPPAPKAAAPAPVTNPAPVVNNPAPVTTTPATTTTPGGVPDTGAAPGAAVTQTPTAGANGVPDTTPGGGTQGDLNPGPAPVAVTPTNAADLTEQQRQEAEYTAAKNLQLNNPNIVNDFGSQTVTRDANGNVQVTQSLSPEQKAILGKGQDLTQKGLDMATSQLSSMAGQPFNPTLTARTSTGDLNADRSRIEDAIFAKFTRNLDQNQSRDTEQTQQRLQNMGIPFSADPNSRYQQEMKALNDRYDTQRENARQTAIQTGGDEYSRDVGIGEQLRTNDLSTAGTIHGTQLNDVNAYSHLGTGLQTPNFQAYQGSQYQGVDPTAAYSTMSQEDLQKQQLALQKAIADLQAKTSIKVAGMRTSRTGGGGGGGGTQDTAFTGL